MKMHADLRNPRSHALFMPVLILACFLGILPAQAQTLADARIRNAEEQRHFVIDEAA